MTTNNVEKLANNPSNLDYLQELEKYLANLSIADYQKYIEFCLRAPSDMRLLLSEVARLRSDIERYREDIESLRNELFNRDKLVNEFRPKANKFDRIVERLQPSDGGEYVNDVVEAFWRYLRDMQVPESGLRLDRSKIEKKLESKPVDSTALPKRNTPILDLKRVDQDQDNGEEKTDSGDSADDEITKPSK